MFRAALIAGLILGGREAEATAAHGPTDGPIYTSREAITYAQAILEAQHLLRAGRYEKGGRDLPTILALRQFQRAHFVRPTGNLDPETMALLSSHEKDKTAPPTPAPTPDSGHKNAAAPRSHPDSAR